MNMPALQTRDLSIGYRQRRRADNCLGRSLNLRLEAGSLVGLLGPNGVGKSTLLRTLAAMQAPLAGQVLLNGEDARLLRPAELAKVLSIVLTNPPHPGLMTGFELVALGRLPHSDWLGKLTDQDRKTIRCALGAVNARDLAGQLVSELSDGQRQKLMIGRALAQETTIMLLDEPTAYLDLPRRVDIMRLLKRLAHHARRAVLVSTHDLDLALRNCDQLWLMRANGMRMGTPEDLVLDGGITETFRADGINFDLHSGAFAAESPGGAAIHVKGKGTRETWLRRALARNGYRLDPAASVAALSAKQNGGGPVWQLEIGGRSSQHDTVEAVLEALKDAAL